ncbi:MAG: 3-dehydroquinate synthase [bacterium]|nr:3-dehydroquinate synthase [bacterium]
MFKQKNEKVAIRKISVKLDRRNYHILIQPGLLNQTGNLVAKLPVGKRVGIITNPTVGKYYAAIVNDSLCKSGFEPCLFSIPDGEYYKNLDIVRDLYSRLIENRFDRNSGLIALGGGVIGDLTGFVAATYLRGIPFIQIPTTLLAQVDSSIGGKVGVNLPEGKNLVGSFYQPNLVIIDPTVLQTLPDRELHAGLAEVIKYGVIYDSSFFNWLEKNMAEILQGQLSLVTKIIARSCEIKAEVVSKDETEQGLRAILNFGHTVGHAIETLTGYATYSHGEAVAIGMVAAGKLALGLSLFKEKELNRLISLIQNAGLPTVIPNLAISQILDTIERDKKVRDRKLRFVLPTELGKVKLVDDIPVSLLKKTMQTIMQKK